MAQVLRPLHNQPAATGDDLVVGFGASDDAGVTRLPDGTLLVQSVDFFTPIVDDPHDWGRIAAANALSDLYAMGARPWTAMQLVSWPREELPFDLLGDVLEGGMQVMGAAGCIVIGGHSIDDREPKYGFAVTGLATSIVTNAGARPGDRLVLTKPLGVGIATTAIKRGAAPEVLVAEATDVMTQLNDRAADAMVEVGVSACTDITGYGLLGHLREVLVASQVSAEVDPGAVPILDGVLELAEEGMIPGGSVRNRASTEPHTDGFSELELRILTDAQTSGGLLIAVTEDRVDSLLTELHARDVGAAAVVGAVVEGPDARIRSS